MAARQKQESVHCQAQRLFQLRCCHLVPPLGALVSLSRPQLLLLLAGHAGSASECDEHGVTAQEEGPLPMKAGTNTDWLALTSAATKACNTKQPLSVVMPNEAVVSNSLTN